MSSIGKKRQCMLWSRVFGLPFTHLALQPEAVGGSGEPQMLPPVYICIHICLTVFEDHCKFVSRPQTTRPVSMHA